MDTYKITENIKYLLLDMDGTLVDTEPIGPATFLEQLAAYGVEPEDTDYELFIRVWRRDGTDLNEKEFLSSIVDKYSITIPVQEYIKDFFELYERNITKADALPGVDAFLEKVAMNSKFTLAIVTASKRSQVQAVLENHNWSSYFDAIVAEEDIRNHKPDPEPFIVGMNKLGADSSETVVFEDSKNGTRAGKAANCTVIGLRAGSAPEQDLSAADAVIESFTDIELPQDA